MRCRICDVEINTNNSIKSHILTNSQYIRPLTKTTKSNILGFSDGEIFNPCHNITDNTILCKKCDNRLNLYESERSKLFKISPEEIIYDNKFHTFKNINSYKIKMACLSDIFRCSITKIKQFERISIGKKNEETIAKILQNCDCDSLSKYPVMIGKLKMPLDFRAVQIPHRIRDEGILYYETVMPGAWIWKIKMDGRTNQSFDKLSVDANGESAQFVFIKDEVVIKNILRNIVASMTIRN